MREGEFFFGFFLSNPNKIPFQAVTFGPATGEDEEPFDTDSHNLLVHFLNNDPETLYRMN